MRIVRRVSGATAIAFMLTGCAVGTDTVAANSSAPTARISNESLSTKQICEGSLGTAVLLDWAPGTVAKFRAYQYGGPLVITPLARAFRGMPGTTRGAWCATKEGADATHWWAVVIDHEPTTVIIIHGPGEGVRHGSVTAPPQVPGLAPSRTANLVKRLVAKTNAPAATSPLPACASGQLEVLASASLGAAGAGAMAFDIVNRGPSCRIGGYPEVTFYNASGVAVDRHNVHQPSMLFAEPRVVTVTLVRGGAATFGVSWNNNTVNNVPYNNHTCPKTAYAVVVLRQGVGRLWGQIPIDPQPCGDTLSVTPIESGTWPRPNG